MLNNRNTKKAERNQKICSLRSEGYTTKEISAEFRLSASTVNKILHKHGLNSIDKEKRLVRDRQIIDLRKQGYKDDYIRTKLGVSGYVVENVCREFDVQSGRKRKLSVIGYPTPRVEIGQVLCDKSKDNLLYDNDAEYWEVAAVYNYCILLYKVIDGKSNQSIRWCPGFAEVRDMLNNN